MKSILIVLLIPFISAYAKLSPFETDSCTYFIDGSWSECCVEHDIRYWMGGDEQQMDESDQKLKECVAEKSNNIWSTIIYQGVRLGHLSPIKSKYEWSWGWSEKDKKFSPLNSTQRVLAVDALRESGLDPKIIEKIIKEHELEGN
ncbi:MAG: hypothetical protein KC478_10195 [Bacteriovoracaceae bacterium]|nr:hypothetical protein [Bacteriovoracaceae bacterium]